MDCKKLSEKTKRRRNRKKMNSGSKVLKCILHCLEYGLNPKVVFWKDKGKGIFVLKFWHKNNPHWNENVLNLFKDAEKTISIPRFEKYRKSSKYDEDCKTRFRANIKKLCKAGALIFIKQETMKDNSKERSYQLTNYSEEVLSDSMKASEVGEIIENICEIDDNEREEKLKVESQVLPSRSSDSSRCNFASPLEDCNFEMAGNHVQMETDFKHIEEVTLNTLNTEIYSTPDYLHMENNLQSCDFQWNDMYERYRFDNATMHSPGKNDLTKLQNSDPIPFEDGWLSMNEREESVDLTESLWKPGSWHLVDV